MLVLTRDVSESVTLYDAQGNELGKVSVVSLGKGKVRLGFELVPSIRILRTELEEPSPAPIPVAA